MSNELHAEGTSLGRRKADIASSLDREIRRAWRCYVAPYLFVYDTAVYRIWNPYVWRCPTETVVEHFRRHVRRVHLEAGCGTGYLPSRCGIPDGRDRNGAPLPPQLTLMDMNPGSLKWASRRLQPYRPKIIRHSLFSPLPAVDPPFESVCLNYVLHCLPGDFEAKRVVIANLKAAMAADGVLFGSTILGLGVFHNRFARLTLYCLNRTLGSFHNTQDTADGLQRALSGQFAHVCCQIVGSVALFAASDSELPPAHRPTASRACKS